MSEENTGQSPQEPGRRSWTEEIELAGSELVDRVREVIAEGNVRRVIVRHEGRTIVEIPLTVAAAASAATIWLSLPLAVLGAVAALLARVQVSIVREGEPPEHPQPPITPS